jgi:hypothetical protein
MGHIDKGCLAGHQDDICSDSSHIESSHKGWNNIQRAQASGLMMFVAMSFDFVHHCNVWITWEKLQQKGFISSTFRSHHIGLFNHVAVLWNTQTTSVPLKLSEFTTVNSNELFGLVRSGHVVSWNGLIKMEDEVNFVGFTDASTTAGGEDESATQSRVANELGLDPASFECPALIIGRSCRCQSPRSLILYIYIFGWLMLCRPSATDLLGTAISALPTSSLLPFAPPPRSGVSASRMCDTPVSASSGLSQSPATSLAVPRGSTKRVCDSSAAEGPHVKRAKVHSMSSLEMMHPTFGREGNDADSINETIPQSESPLPVQGGESTPVWLLSPFPFQMS